MRYIVLFLLLTGCAQGLPHRPIDSLTNWGQGRAPAIHDCPPGTMEFDTEEGLFLECFSTGLVTAHELPPSDPSAPPPSPEVREMISRYVTPVSTTQWPHFNTITEAAVYGSNRVGKCSQNYECSGIIVLDPKGKFVVGPVHTDYNSDSVRIMVNETPSDWQLAATFHSHPCLPNHANQLFSPQDVMNSITRRVISFMVDLCDGSVHEFIPGKNRPDTELFDGIWMTQGAVIAHVPPAKMALANDGL